MLKGLITYFVTERSLILFSTQYFYYYNFVFKYDWGFETRQRHLLMQDVHYLWPMIEEIIKELR